MFRVGDAIAFQSTINYMTFFKVFTVQTDTRYVGTILRFWSFCLICLFSTFHLVYVKIGTLEEINDEEAFVNSMSPNGNSWKWPSEKDVIWYKFEDIVEKINEPVLINNNKRENIDVDTSEDLVVILGGMGILLICIFSASSSRRWTSFLHNLIDFEKYGKPDGIEYAIERGNYWAHFFGLYYIIGTVIYGIVTYMEAPSCHRLNNEKNLHLICDTFVAIWLPFDIPLKSIRLLLFFIQFVLIACNVNPAAMACFLTWECTEILRCHLRHLKKHFHKMVKEGDIRKRPDGIGYWIRYHNHILSLSYELKSLFKISVGHTSLISGLVIGCTENQILKSKPLGASLFFLGWMAAMMLLCHAGEILMEETLSVADTLRDSQWYLADLETRRDMVFIMLRSQKPVHLEAMPLGVMNYALFVMILRTSYSFMTLLNQSS